MCVQGWRRQEPWGGSETLYNFVPRLCLHPLLPKSQFSRATGSRVQPPRLNSTPLRSVLGPAFRGRSVSRATPPPPAPQDSDKAHNLSQGYGPSGHLAWDMGFEPSLCIFNVNFENVNSLSQKPLH